MFAGILAVYVAGDNAANVGVIASPAIAAIATITGAYFGMKLGQEGAKAATDTVQQAATAATAAAQQANQDATAARQGAGEAVAAASASKAAALTHAKLLEKPGQTPLTADELEKTITRSAFR